MHSTPPDAVDRVEYESPLEDLFRSLMAFSGCLGMGALGLLGVGFAFGVLGLIYGEDASGWTRPMPKIFLFMVLALVASFLFGWIRSQIDIHYFLDRNNRRVLLRRKVFFYRSETVVADFQDLHCLAVAGKFVSESQGKAKPPKEYWMTALWLVTRRGHKIRVSDYKPHLSWSPEDSPLPKTLGLDLVISPSGDHALKIRRGPQGPELKFVGDSWTWLAGIFWGILLTLAAAAGMFALGDWLK